MTRPCVFCARSRPRLAILHNSAYCSRECMEKSMGIYTGNLKNEQKAERLREIRRLNPTWGYAWVRGAR